MARSRRTRSTSGGSYREMTKQNVATSAEVPCPATCRLLSSVLQWRHAESGKTLLHAINDDSSRFTIAALLFTRLRQLPAASEDKLVTQWLTVRDQESGYTPLHSAIYQGDLKMILLILRHASSSFSNLDAMSMDDPLMPPRSILRPMEALRMRDSAAKRIQANVLLKNVLSARDNEGFTPGQLLASLQVSELKRCRANCVYRPKFNFVTANVNARRARRPSFIVEDEEEGRAHVDGDAHQQNEFGALARHVERLPRDGAQERGDEALLEPSAPSDGSHYACEVFTFGRANPCVLGGGQDSAPEQVRPQRVQEFAQSHITDGAVNIAAAAHHTMVVTKSGKLYSFGLGKGGRLGTGCENNVPLPTRVLGVLSKKIVVAVAAAENHSLCATQDGMVFSWGSNGYGQLGFASGSLVTGTGAVRAVVSAESSRCQPRRVDDLKGVHCVAVAAGIKHSVALSKHGEVYVWGDNTTGQLALSRRGGVHKVQRVEALWSNGTTRKKVIAIAAADQTTLLLAQPSGTGIPLNSVYSWGHGNHVPAKVHFDSTSRYNHRDRPVNPVSIACAKYHNAAVSSDGLVYTWGLHADPLGTATRCASSQPQLVTGLLSENGGGFAVAIAASENHTAVVTDTGALYTWGATSGKDVLGHAGVRWQEEPKCVAGVHRVVGVAAAKEHTVLLVGTSFPEHPKTDATSLEAMSIRTVAEHLDVFNILPSLIVAERTASIALIDYCIDFITRNLDGVMNVAQRSVLDCYLNEQIQSCYIGDKVDRDSELHPLLDDIVKAGSGGLSDATAWYNGCERLLGSESAALFEKMYGNRDKPIEQSSSKRLKSDALFPGSAMPGRKSAQKSAPVHNHLCSERCLLLTTDMDLSTRELVEAKHVCIVKEVRAVRKRLNQIDKLEVELEKNLTAEQRDKLSRRPQLDADLLKFEPALKLIERTLLKFNLSAASAQSESMPSGSDDSRPSDALAAVADEQSLNKRQQFFCQVCHVKCPDESSYALHVSGRKHRNKVNQAEEAERKQAANSIMECQIERDFTELSFRALKSTVPVTAVWNKTAGSPLPKYKLPGPPHGAPSTIISAKQSAVSLREIMEQEVLKSSPSKLAAKSTGQKVVSSPPLRTPSAPTLRLPVGSAPTMARPPWVTSAVADIASMPVEKPCARSFLALGEFVKKPSIVPKALPTKSVAWNPSKTPTMPSPVSGKGNFLEIQQQQTDFKERQAKVYSSPDTKWFVEQRERAGSFKEIQLQHEKDEEERMYVEEQFWIEKQIMEELASAKKEPRGDKKKNNGKKTKPSRAAKGAGAAAACSRAEAREPKDDKSGSARKSTDLKKPFASAKPKAPTT